MMKSRSKNTISGVIVAETTTFSLSQVCLHCKIPREILEQMFVEGIVESSQQLHDDYRIDLIALKRIESAFRLYRDLEINLPGISLILDLKAEIERLQSQLNLLQKHLDLGG